MDTQGISAFAAFAAKKAKILEQKSKSKRKMKLNAREGFSRNLAPKNAADVTEPSTSEIRKKKIKKKDNESKKLIRSILEAQKQSIYQGCAVTATADNMSLNDEGSGAESFGKKKTKKSLEGLTIHKKSKKIKLMNGVAENHEFNENIQKGSENLVSINGDLEIIDLEPDIGEPELEITADDVIYGKNGVTDGNKSSERAKNTLDKKSELKKSMKRKEKNGENNSSKKKKKKKEKAESNHVQATADYLSLNENSKEKESGPKLPEIIFADSMKVGEEVLSWMLSPFSVKKFFKTCWERRPLYIQHYNKNYFKQICTLEVFKEALKENDMYFTKNIDITSYIDGERHTENPEGKATPSVVWDFYKSGRSVRLLNPQTFIRNVRILNSTLQEFFHCFVGANIYLTPPGTQGFAPHYDDIEAFVLQLEGEKHWKLYNPRTPKEVLPRESSRNFKESEIGNPVFEVTLQPGDLLYFPRGFIHQAKCLPHVHSLHMTVSCYQKCTWADLLEKIIPVALSRAVRKDVEFRKGLPVGYSNFLGLIHSEQNSKLRQVLKGKLEELFHKIAKHFPTDAAADQMAAGFIHDALPPCLTEAEELHGGDRNYISEKRKFLDVLRNSSEKNLRVKLIRSTCVRLVSENGEVYLYYTTDNSLVYHENEVSSVPISGEWVLALERLICSYPNFVEVKALPISQGKDRPATWESRVDFVYFLWQKGLLLFDQPLREICA